MKYMKNPVTGEIVYATPLMAKKLARYEWTYVTKKDWVDYKRAQIQLSIARNVRQARMSVH